MTDYDMVIRNIERRERELKEYYAKHNSNKEIVERLNSVYEKEECAIKHPDDHRLKYDVGISKTELNTKIMNGEIKCDDVQTKDTLHGRTYKKVYWVDDETRTNPYSGYNWVEDDL